MVKHIVLFKLKDEVSAEEKLVVMNKFKEAIEALPAKIAVIRKVEVEILEAEAAMPGLTELEAKAAEETERIRIRITDEIEFEG